MNVYVGDSQATFWCIQFKDGLIQSGVEGAIAKFPDLYKIPTDPLISLDRENQSLVVVFSDRKYR